MMMESTSDRVARPGCESYHVACPACGHRFDAVAATWCGCVSTENSVACPRCGGCACRAEPRYRHAFWHDAPPTMWRRRQENRERMQQPLASVDGGAVLVIDDDVAIQRAAALVIAGLGLSFMVAGDGAEGLRLARRHQPRVILTDALLPRLGGRELCRALKQDPACAASRVILMTALYTRPSHVAEARGFFGADDFVMKPIEVEGLRRTLMRHLWRSPGVLEERHA